MTEVNLNNYFLPYQVDHILDESPAVLEEKSRRIGITYANSFKHCRRRNLIDYPRHLWFSSADDSAAYEYAQYCRMWCDIVEASVKEILEPYDDVVNNQVIKRNNYIVQFPNGSRINCMTSNPKRFRSKGGDVVLDEFAFHENAGMMWDAASPTTTWGFTIEILSTHNGESSLFNSYFISNFLKVQRGEATFDGLKMLPWHHRRTTIVDAVNQGLAEKVYKLTQPDPAAREKFLKFCRARCRNEDQWNQEYMCVPSTEESTLIPYDLYVACQMADCLQPAAKCGKGPFYLGFDIARTKHKTVFWIDELVGDVLICRAVVRMHNATYGTQQQMAEDLINQYNIVRACGDATGLGDMLVEKLQERFGTYRVEKVRFSAPVKDAMASRLLGQMQDKRRRLPDDIECRESFHAIKKTVSANGNVRYDTTQHDEEHSDEFWAAALCGEAANTAADIPMCYVA
ncbi:MAG: terminase family protein [Planctomycetaceae bacterium]|nr:terminase family protein [Planctomycetaceae bacterium]